MSKIFEDYYKGIHGKLQSEINYINSIFDHQPTKGAANERLLRELIKKFIPSRFGVGTGVVIDKKGNQSKQIDIIVYDKMNYPSLFSLTHFHFFPVDIVYAVIEVKTCMDKEKAKEALGNIYIFSKKIRIS